MVLHPRERVLFVAIGLAWLAVGWFGRAPSFDRPVWMMLCAVPAGASFAMAEHLSPFALRSFAISTATVGLLRGLTYVLDEDTSSGALWVWVIVICLALFVWHRIDMDSRR